jgi:transmembrane sensor
LIGQKTYDLACDWIILLDSDAVTAAERAEFVRWLNQEPENSIAYNEMSQLWARLDTLGTVPECTEELFPVSPLNLRPASKSQNFSQWVLASIFLIAVLCGLVIGMQPGQSQLNSQQFVTSQNQNHRVVTVDGSVIELGPLSAIELEFSNAMRQVHLQRGTVTFTVAKDEDRPFVVNIGNSKIRALGTKFTAHVDNAHTAVSVIEGSIRFSSEARKAKRSSIEASITPASTLILTAGQSLTFQPETRTIQLN